MIISFENFFLSRNLYLEIIKGIRNMKYGIFLLKFKKKYGVNKYCFFVIYKIKLFF